MAEAALPRTETVSESTNSSLIVRIAWRNLWRNKRRTWLTAGGIAFATLLVNFGISTQVGTYDSMIDNATRFLAGHMQVTHADYPEENKLEQTVMGATDLVRRLENVPDLYVAPRAEAFALLSADERSFGGLIVGVDFAREANIVSLFDDIAQGRIPHADDEILVGTTMARNLGVGLGDEVVALGSAKQGGIAAMAQTVVGIYASGQAEIDRTLVFVTLPAVQNAFALGDEVHKIVVRGDNPQDMSADLRAASGVVDNSGLVRSWQEVMPELNQAIQLDWVSAQLVYGILLLLVSFSVINTFLMVVFERTREFGMLIAIGMRPSLIVWQVLTEAFFMWLVGVVIGVMIALAIVVWLANVGIPIAGMEGMEEMAGSMFISDRIYPAYSWVGIMAAPIVLLFGTQLAGLVATMRVRRIKPVEALRGE